MLLPKRKTQYRLWSQDEKFEKKKPIKQKKNVDLVPQRIQELRCIMGCKLYPCPGEKQIALTLKSPINAYVYLSRKKIWKVFFNFEKHMRLLNVVEIARTERQAIYMLIK